jgi:hypothetical protein
VSKKTKITGAKVLYYDLETSPIIGAVWGRYQQDLAAVIRESEILSIAWSWNDENKIHSLTRAEVGLKSDKGLCRELHKLIDSADIVVSHNGEGFDHQVGRTRMAFHKILPPSGFKSIDTLRVARGRFRFSSNRLGDLAEFLGVGKKLETGGIKLWLDCMAGLGAAFERMGRYNRHDVTLLKGVYKYFRPWILNHPSIVAAEDAAKACPRCYSTNFQRRGFNVNAQGKYQRYVCMNCGGAFSDRKAQKGTSAKGFKVCG